MRFSLPDLHHLRRRLFDLHDLPRRSDTRDEEPDGVPLDLLVGWECLGHGDQGESISAVSARLERLD